MNEANTPMPGRRVERFCWLVTGVNAVYACFLMVGIEQRGDELSAIQYTSAAIGVMTWLIIPLVFSLAVSGWRRSAP